MKKNEKLELFKPNLESEIQIPLIQDVVSRVLIFHFFSSIFISRISLKLVVYLGER